MRTPDDLRAMLERAWCLETRSKNCTGPWTPETPSIGQCVPTTLIVQDEFGGIILRTNASTAGAHYFNRLPGGNYIDLTRDQFPQGTIFEESREFPRWSMLHSPTAITLDIIGQYALLKRRVGLP